MRSLTKPEQFILLEMSKYLSDEQKKQFLYDVDHAVVEKANPDGSRVKFFISGYERQAYEGQHAYSVEGRMLDVDGEVVSVYIYADKNNRLLELEYVKWSDTPIIELQWNSFSIV
jgi:hypothetical protein